MPVWDGMEATKRIRSSKAEFRDIPIIGLTAHAMSSDKKQCLNTGMSDYIAKPVEKDDLIEVIRRNL